MSTSDKTCNKISQLKETLKETGQKAQQQARRFGLGVVFGAATILPSFAQQKAPTQNKNINSIEQTQKQQAHTVRSGLGTVTYAINGNKISKSTSHMLGKVSALMPALYDNTSDGSMQIGPVKGWIENMVRSQADFELSEVIQDEAIYQDIQQKNAEKPSEWMAKHDAALKAWGIERTVNGNVVTLLQTDPMNQTYKTSGISFEMGTDNFQYVNTKSHKKQSKELYTIRDVMGELSYISSNDYLKIEYNKYTYQGLSGSVKLLPEIQTNHQTGQLKIGPIKAANQDDLCEKAEKSLLGIMDTARIYGDIKRREANGEELYKAEQDYCQTAEKQLKDDWNIEIQYKNGSASLKNMKTQYVFSLNSNNNQQQAQNNAVRTAQTRGGGR
jgi:hypothetical protein